MTRKQLNQNMRSYLLIGRITSALLTSIDLDLAIANIGHIFRFIVTQQFSHGTAHFCK